MMIMKKMIIKKMIIKKMAELLYPVPRTSSEAGKR